jgi:hypothetical protein
MTSTWHPLRLVGTWAARSQESARRNALVASTSLAQRRRERQEVEEFLADYLDARATTSAAPDVAGATA